MWEVDLNFDTLKIMIIISNTINIQKIHSKIPIIKIVLENYYLLITVKILDIIVET